MTGAVMSVDDDPGTLEQALDRLDSHVASLVNLSRLQQALDRLDSHIACLVNLTRLPDRIHVQALREALPQIAAEIRSALLGGRP